MFNSLLQQHHYLGYTQPVGEHLVRGYALVRDFRQRLSEVA
ncbi:hypothetical protein [Accumulibacter sp.]|nr:hypothetical protein [Accumulibacter sp.]